MAEKLIELGVNDVNWAEFKDFDKKSEVIEQEYQFHDFNAERVVMGVVVGTTERKFADKVSNNVLITKENGETVIIGDYAVLKGKLFTNGKLNYHGRLIKITRSEYKTQGAGENDYYTFEVRVGAHYKMR